MTRTINKTQKDIRTHHVGSFLRPENLQRAKMKYQNSEISLKEEKEIEDKEVNRIIKKQVELGFNPVTDGEFRQKGYYFDFFTACQGIDAHAGDPLIFNNDTKAANHNFSITGKIKLGKHPVVDNFVRTKEIADKYGVEVKLTIPSPNLIIYRDETEKEKEFYKNHSEVFADIVVIYKELIQKLYDAGCRHLQFDDTAWNNFFSDFGYFEAKGIDRAQAAEVLKQNTNEVLAAAPEDLTTYVHICRGNFKSEHMTSGGYDSISQLLFSQLDYDYLLVEYDDERSGTFESLKNATKDGQIVVLGLITSKSGELESKDEIISQIRKATKYLPLDKIAISPQCGFASTEDGNELTEEEQWNKLDLIHSVANKVWGENDFSFD